MSISPPSDLILDVMRAADPQHVQAAAQRLKSLAAARASHAQAAAWPGKLAAVRIAAKQQASPSPALFATKSEPPARAEINKTHPAKPKTSLRKSMAKLEGVLIEGMLNQMMSSSTGVFGKGLAGEYWKSMLAEAIASQIAERGGLGVASALVRRGAGPDGLSGAAEAIGLRQQFERQFLSSLRDSHGQAVADVKEAS